MAIKVLMPKLGLTMTGGTIEEWKFKEGDTIKKGDVIFSVATDKLTNDVESDANGVLLKILCSEGETVACKSTVAYIGQAGETVEDKHDAQKEQIAEKKTVDEAAQQKKKYFTNEYVLATPCAKRRAREMGIKLASVNGTGPDGVIVLKDVEGFHRGTKTTPMAAKLAAENSVDLNSLNVEGRIMKADVIKAVGMSASDLEEPESNDFTAKRVSPLRRAIAANMINSWNTSPAVTFTYAVDVTELKKMRTKLKSSFKEKGLKLTYNHILMKVVANVLTQFADINASFSDNMLTYHKHVNIGLAVAKNDGLIVPNVKQAELKSLTEIAEETEALIEATRNGTVAVEDITGGTFTITSLGVFGVRDFSPIINQPELAILGVCDMIDTPVVVNGQIEIRPMMNLCLTADHRVIDGVQACKFMQKIVEILENPYLLLA